FHTAIHKFVVNGEEHWANASDPQIPSALGSVVGGVATLHNFVKKAHVKISEHVVSAKATAGKSANMILSDGTHAMSPADFAKIYNVPNMLQSPPGTSNGATSVIAIVGRSNINAADIQNFRNVFGLPAIFSQNNVLLNGPDPGNLGGNEEVEAVLDASWSGAVAPLADVLFVVSASTDTTDGVDLSEAYIIDNNLAPVMSESFGACEQGVGSSEATNESNIAEQAAAQGITFMASTGDSGAKGCDDSSETAASGPNAVQLPSALPFAVAVGGTMFIENDNAFWNTTDTSTFESAKSFITENVWNESCATANQCEPEVIADGVGPNILAGGGGASIFFPKPVWQTGVAGIPAANFRVVPDVSLHAAVFHDGTVLCIASLQASCVEDNTGAFSLILVGGTSVAAPSFAGVMALVNEKTGQAQGQADFVLYRLAAGETLSSCNGSKTSPLPASNCIFNDTTVGNNAVPGETGYGTGSAQFQAGVGYDEGTGLGSLNVANLLTQWSTARTKASTTTIAIPATFPVAHGTSVSVNITVTGSGGTPTGDVSLIAHTGASQSIETGGITLSPSTLVLGSVAATTTGLPGGSYTAFAHYGGDGTFLPSDSASGVNVNITPEMSTTTVTIESANSQLNPIPFTSGPYGSFVYLRADVAGKSGKGTPTGSVNFTDTVNAVTTNVPGDPYTLNSEGNTAAPNGFFTFGPGQHGIIAQYGG
ncbi:MAG: Ig-like domain repeat protein, partial [Candidatus Acidiferrales bacterium]